MASGIPRGTQQWIGFGLRLQLLERIAVIENSGQALHPLARPLTITPGRQPTGTVYLLGPTAQTTATLGGQSVGDGHQTRQVRIAAGTIIVPEDSEAARLTAITDPESWDALKAMGYVE